MASMDSEQLASIQYCVEAAMKTGLFGEETIFYLHALGSVLIVLAVQMTDYIFTTMFVIFLLSYGSALSSIRNA